MGAICILGQVSYATSCHCKFIAQKCFANGISHTSYANLLLAVSLQHLTLNSTPTREDSLAPPTATVIWEPHRTNCPGLIALVTHLFCSAHPRRWSSLACVRCTGKLPQAPEAASNLPKCSLLFMGSVPVLSHFK